MKRSHTVMALLAVTVTAVLIVAVFKGEQKNRLPSAFIDKPAPTFVLPRLFGEALFDSAQLWQGKTVLLNVWGAWCTTCYREHPALLAITQRYGVPMYGLNLRDEKKAAQHFLATRGNPYQAVAVDADGTVAIDYGVAAAPETFLIDAHGIIRHKHTGLLTEVIFRRDFLPLLATPEVVQ